MAARMLPNLLFGLMAGTLADRGDRGCLLVLVRLVALPNTLAFAWLAATPGAAAWELISLSFVAGCVSTFDVPSRQALVIDTVPREVAPNAMALHATVSRLCTAVGAFIVGVLIPFSGVASAFVATAAVFALAALIGLLVRPTTVSIHQRGGRPTFGKALREASRLAFDVPALRTLVLAAVACEVLGFSFQTATPAFARDVLGAGAEGLGSMNAATSLGGAVAVVGLSLIPRRVPREPLLGAVFVVYGLSLLALATTRELVLAAGVLLVTGACAASFDVLQQTLMQLSVPEEQRGRAVGIWVLSLGSGPIGNLEMGALVALLGASSALAINGALVLVAAAVLLLLAPSYRRVHG
jgi:MFS family permease